ncbi:hypothetical protein F5J12DRAFT_926304 [Pisolithus orientalis]|uniref:uncharacterized protein n=1 Tax=Pisolithus orientalis TaxID=936130 RepID=UPI00222455EB|nr:uncharacterized protein F5J12DRAFT_926304 [Pisolithus orientalis]KAI6015332.1 hypothetical protein F5J12DRAFT_926304 [Pisolithus orientalis]
MSNLNLHTEFQYDDLGNPFICNSSGTWVPYLEYAWAARVDTPSVPHDVPSAHLFMGGDLGLNTCHYIRQRPANEPFIQHQNAGGGSTLILPATFPDGRDASSNTPGGVDSCIDLVLFPSLRAMTGHLPSVKVAGTQHAVQPSSKCKGKESAGSSKRGKKRSLVVDVDAEPELVKLKQGCPQGAGNYSTVDTSVLLDFVEVELPLGQCRWQAVTTKFNQWAAKHKWPECKLIKTPKPTGDADCPPEVKHVHHIDNLINEQAGTYDLNDSDFDDANKVDKANSSSSVQHACEEEHANHSLTNIQYLTFSQQLHDEWATNDKLCAQIFDLHNHLYEAQQACDCAEMQLEMMHMGPHAVGNTPMYHNLPKHKHQSYCWFPDGENEAGSSNMSYEHTPEI